MNVVFDTHIASNPFVLNLMDKLAALENSLSAKSANVIALGANNSSLSMSSFEGEETAAGEPAKEVIVTKYEELQKALEVWLRVVEVVKGKKSKD